MWVGKFLQGWHGCILGTIWRALWRLLAWLEPFIFLRLFEFDVLIGRPMTAKMIQRKVLLYMSRLAAGKLSPGIYTGPTTKSNILVLQLLTWCIAVHLYWVVLFKVKQYFYGVATVFGRGRLSNKYMRS